MKKTKTEVKKEIEPLIQHGAFESKKDSRTIIEPSQSGLWQSIKNSFSYGPINSGSLYKDIFSQNSVGICTIASLITGIWNKTGIKGDENFGYFLLKKYIDNVEYPSSPAWFEGSSLLNALRCIDKFGIVRSEYVEKYFKRDPNENYPTYIARMQKAFTPQVEAELLSKAEKVISYTQIKDLNDSNLALYLNDDKSFVYTRNVCGDTWYFKFINGVRYSAFWSMSKIINPITMPTSTYFPPSGHAICLAQITAEGKNYANTFGKNWNMDGHGIVAYSPTEAYRVYVNSTPKIVEENKLVKKTEFKYTFNKNLYPNPFYSKDVEALQTVLMYENCIDFIPANQRGYFGAKTLLAVKKFQSKHGITPTSGLVYQKTRAILNSIYA